MSKDKDNKDETVEDVTAETKAVEAEPTTESVATKSVPVVQDDLTLRLANAEKKIKVLTIVGSVVLGALIIIAGLGFCLRMHDDRDRGRPVGPGGIEIKSRNSEEFDGGMRIQERIREGGNENLPSSRGN